MKISVLIECWEEKRKFFQFKRVSITSCLPILHVIASYLYTFQVSYIKKERKFFY